MYTSEETTNTQNLNLVCEAGPCSPQIKKDIEDNFRVHIAFTIPGKNAIALMLPVATGAAALFLSRYRLDQSKEPKPFEAKYAIWTDADVAEFKSVSEA